jgi:Uma2 family endonuclease
MSVTRSTSPPARSVQGLRYLEERPPIVFPEEERVPESNRHFELRVLLYLLLRDTYAERFTVGSDQFMYFDAEDPSQSVAPDIYVRLELSPQPITSWKVWERGVPEVAAEFVSKSDSGHRAWQYKLARYARLGVSEVVRFDPNDEQRPLRIWDRVDGPLVEREVSGRRAPSLVLDHDWLVAPAEQWDCALRIVREGVVVPTSRELVQVAEERARVERQAREVERQAREVERQAREVERQAREVAEARVRELEAELARRA